MTVVAADLSRDCGLDVYADSIWIGYGCIGLGMVFKGNSIGENVRTPEDDEKLKKLEERLVELEFITTPELQVLCSCSFLPHLEEPTVMAMRAAPDDGRNGILEVADYWGPGGGYDRQRRKERKERKERKAQREKDRAKTR